MSLERSMGILNKDDEADDRSSVVDVPRGARQSGRLTSFRSDYTIRIVVTGRELHSIRQKLALTQAALAEAIGVTSNTVARWERDEMAISEPAARLIEKIAKEHKIARRGA